MTQPTTPLVLRDTLLSTRAAYHQGRASIDELNAAADTYIEAIVAWAKEHKRKLRRPSRAYILRAL